MNSEVEFSSAEQLEAIEPVNTTDEEQGLKRRSFLKILGAAGIGTLHADRIQAQEVTDNQEQVGVLIDTTRCMGCRTCEFTCAEVHGFPEPDSDFGVFEEERTPSETQWIVVNEYSTEIGEVYVKKQCMHCVQPACASACLTKAMYKTDKGPVIWRGNKCMGCRFCMISCPFDVPKFEYDSANPRILKCNLCWDRQQEGALPSCVENCPGEALTFGKRSDLLEEARSRIYSHPDQYYHRIYGEDTAGGTSIMYLSAVPFDQIGFRKDVGTTPYPEYSKGFLYAVPIILTLVPPFLLAISNAAKRVSENEQPGADND
jgi:Fe-S-cluster-containing dehydrogenase component